MNCLEYLKKNFKVNTRSYLGAEWPDDKLLQINERRIIEFNPALRYKEYHAYIENDSRGNNILTIEWMHQEPVEPVDVNNAEAADLVNEVHRWFDAVSRDYIRYYKPVVREYVKIKLLVWSREDDVNDAVPIILDYIV